MKTIKIVTWNVNSIRIRLELLIKLVNEYSPDIICLQEVKAKEEDFPFSDIKKIVQKWYVLSVLTGRYSSSPETKFYQDLKMIKENSKIKR